MHGVGEIYRMFASGELIDDDEVAVIHGPVETGYESWSSARVDIRATIGRAVAEQVVDADTGTQMLAAAKAMFYPYRSASAALAATAGAHAAARQRLSIWSESHAVAQKRDDARELLTLLRFALAGVTGNSGRTVRVELLLGPVPPLGVGAHPLGVGATDGATPRA